MVKWTAQVSQYVPEKLAYLCIYNTTNQQRLSLDQIKLKHYRVEVWPFVTDASDNLKRTTTQDSAFMHSLLLTRGNHFSHFRRHDSKIKRHNLGEIISKRAHGVSEPQTNVDTQVVISELGIYQTRAEHILCLYLPCCKKRYDNRSVWRKLKQDAPHTALLPPRADRMKT